MGFFVVFLVSLGALCVAADTECVPETAKCSKYWVKMLPHKNLMESEDELNLWCSKQDSFYQCLEEIFLEGKSGNLSFLPTNLLISKLFARDICSDGSKNRERLLNNAQCINSLNTDFCILPEYLDIVTPDDAIPSTRCSQAEKTFSCIAATMVLNCGFDAGRVYRAMLKITRYSDEVCGIETSDGIPPCEGSYSKSVDREKKLSGIYYGLFHRIGDVLDQHSDHSVLEEFSEESNEAITEAIQSAIDNLDKNLVSEELLTTEHDSTAFQSSCRKDVKEYKPYMKNPHITEVFKGVLFYNYSGIEYSAYWRQPQFVVFDRFVCQHLLPSFIKSTVFQCRGDFRYEDPDCLSNVTAYETLTPEFIRSFDPEVPCDSIVEFGPRPEWMKHVDNMYEEKRIRKQLTTPSEISTEAPEFVTASSTLLHLVSTARPRYSFGKLFKDREHFKREWHKYDVRDYGYNSLLPNEIHEELYDYIKPDLVSGNFERIPTSTIKVGDSVYTIVYNLNITEPVENATCSRINECHPKGRGLWKCKVWPRRIEPCDTCGVMPTEKPSFDFIKYARPANRSTLNVQDTTEPSLMVDSSVVENPTPIEESRNLIFSGDSDPERRITIEQFEDESEQLNELDLMMDQAYSDEPEDSDADVDDYNVKLQLNSIFKDLDSSQVVYAIEGTDIDDESEIIISTDGSLDGNIILVSNISDLDETKYAVVAAPSELSE